LALWIAELNRTDAKKLPPSQRTKLERHLLVRTELHHAVQKARGK
jgi:hypothetical protein